MFPTRAIGWIEEVGDDDVEMVDANTGHHRANGNGGDGISRTRSPSDDGSTSSGEGEPLTYYEQVLRELKRAQVTSQLDEAAAMAGLQGVSSLLISFSSGTRRVPPEWSSLPLRRRARTNVGS